MDGDEPTQATQNILDPRRVGKQNSGFSDEAISDILCVLYPHSVAARKAVHRLASEDSPHVIGKNEADGVEPDYDVEDHASRFLSKPDGHGNFAIILRLSSPIKNPEAGFTFGRNIAKCDVVLSNDPHRRISNVHFSIYVNEYGNVMIEDSSTNGTFVDNMLLTSNPKKANGGTTRRVLSSGTVIEIYLSHETEDFAFRVRIPRRDAEYEDAYIQKVYEYFARHRLRGPVDIVGPGPGGHVDLFSTAGNAGTRYRETAPMPAQSRAVSRPRENHSAIRREWNGSGKYNRAGMIGKGAFAVVYKVTCKKEGVPYAAKELEKLRFIKNGVLDAKVENEMRIMQQVEHPNIVQYVEHFDWDDRLLIIIMEYVPGGDLGKLLADGGVFTEGMTRTISRQLLSALGYLHQNKITHRDVKPDNILISSRDPLEVKLTDFGLSKMVDKEQTFLRTFCGTLLYCAPEVYTEFVEYNDEGIRNRGQKVRRAPGQRYNHAVDIWSLGGVLFFTLTGSPPYPVKTGISYSELLHKIMTTALDIRPLLEHDVSEQGIDFLCQMLQKRPEHRATVEHLDSHPWLGGSVLTIKASQSVDEILDEEELSADQSHPQGDFEEDDYISDSGEDEAEKENHSRYIPRLWGEIGLSTIAAGSSGALPGKGIDLTSPRAMRGLSESQSDQAYDSVDFPTGTHIRRREASAMANQSADQLQSLVENVASQSLGESEATPRNPGSSIYSMRSIDFNASKRKPPSPLESSDDYEESEPRGKPGIKRLKSDVTMEGGLPDEVIEEYKLLARMPQVTRLGSGRQIDGPVSKIIYWEQDRRTWHLNYPEMTQLQQDAFVQAAREGGEEFAPGKTPLWDLAMKYFPATGRLDGQNGHGPSEQLRRENSGSSDEPIDFPLTAVPSGQDSIRNSPSSDSPSVVRIQANSAASRAVGRIDSDPESCIPSISFPITDCLVSFGRGLDNTQVFEARTEIRVPKYAFKILLWKDGYDPSKDLAKASHPWTRDMTDTDSYSFWISTKATIGIRINGQVLSSSNPKDPSGSSVHWAKIHDGDSLLIWGGGDLRNQTRLIFRCFWGASSRPRGGDKHLEVASPSIAHKLDTACHRTEKRLRDVVEGKRKRREAEDEHAERRLNLDMERERSRLFEERRMEAVGFLHSKRNSPTGGVPSAQMGRLQTILTPTHMSRLSPI